MALEGDAWTERTDREALRLLTERGLWRLAGDDGWMHIVGQDEEDDEGILQFRVARMERRYPEPLIVVPSANFPGLNPRFLVVTPVPYPTELDALRMKRQWRSLRRNYVKRAWQAVDACNP